MRKKNMLKKIQTAFKKIKIIFKSLLIIFKSLLIVAEVFKNNSSIEFKANTTRSNIKYIKKKKST